MNWTKQSALAIMILLLGGQKAHSVEKEVEIKDVVVEVREHQGDHKVLFRKHAGIYYLKKGNKSHVRIMDSLKASIKAESQVKFKVEPTYLELLELVE